MDDPTTTLNDAADMALIAVLNQVREAARAHFAHYELQVRMGQWLAPVEPRFHTLADIVLPVYRAHPAFAAPTVRFFGSKQAMFDPTYQVGNLVRLAAKTTSAKAVAWLYRAMAIDRTDIRYVAEVYGIKTDAVLRLSNGVTLVPLAELPDSENARAILAQFELRPGPSNFRMEGAIGAYYIEPDIASIPTHTESIEARSSVLERTIRAFTLAADAAPVVAGSWVEFVDPDMVNAEFGRMHSGSRVEGALPTIPHVIDDYAVMTVERYLALPPERAQKLDVAIARLNLGRRRYAAGDQAIEAGICLEALLGDKDSQQDLSHKVRTRAALLLSSDPVERKTIRTAAKKLYHLRSKTVHGAAERLQDRRENYAVAKAGLDVAAQVLKTIFMRDTPLDPSDLDIGA